MKYRKHHNNKGYRQIKEGKTRLYIEYLKKKLNKIIGTNKMEQTQEQNKSLAQQLVDEYYGNYEKVKPSEAELPNILSIVEFMLDKYHLGISIEPLKMTVERIKEIQKTTGYPDSVPVQQALLQVWNEVAQESNQVQAVVMPNEVIGGGHLTDKEFETLSVRITPAFYDIDLDGATNWGRCFKKAKNNFQ